jgi:pimeloyl-ACP methyl ester carboxylesterase
MNFEQFRAPGGSRRSCPDHLGCTLCEGQTPAWRRERWDTPDGDFIDIDFSSHPASAPTLVLFHGLEGSSSSHYAKALAQVCAQRGWHLAVPHFRGCSGEPNRLLRAYHSGDADEVDWILRRLQQGASGGLLAMGVSLGGNALARWAGLQQQAAAELVKGAAVICAPLDLVAGGVNLGRGSIAGSTPPCSCVPWCPRRWPNGSSRRGCSTGSGCSARAPCMTLTMCLRPGPRLQGCR